MTRSRPSRPGSTRSADAVMTATRSSRRQFVAAALAGAGASLLPRPLIAQGAQPRIVVIGGGFAGATAARFLKRADPRLDVTLVEPNAIFAACPLSHQGIARLGGTAAHRLWYCHIPPARAVWWDTAPAGL